MFPFSWEFHHPNWLSLIFFRGVAQPATRRWSKILGTVHRHAVAISVEYSGFSAKKRSRSLCQSRSDSDVQWCATQCFLRSYGVEEDEPQEPSRACRAVVVPMWKDHETSGFTMLPDLTAPLQRLFAVPVPQTQLDQGITPSTTIWCPRAISWSIMPSSSSIKRP